MALNAAARDKGRHRSGSSVSSSDGGLFVFNHSDLTSPPSAARPLGSATNQCVPYLGRGTMVPGPQSLGPNLRPVHSGGKAQPTRTISKKLTSSSAQPPPAQQHQQQQQQQQQPSCGTLGPVPFLTDRSASVGISPLITDSAPTAQSMRGLMAADSTRSGAANSRSLGSHLPQHQPTIPVPLLQSEYL